MIFTCPGKLGDALMQWPVAFQWAKQTGKTFRLWLDEKTCGPLKPLFEAQACCEEAILRPGIQNHSQGGQPWDWDLKTEDLVGQEIVHLGMRAFPDKQITLYTSDQMPFRVDLKALCRDPSLTVTPDTGNRLVLHGTFTSHHTGVPGFWKFLNSVRQDLEDQFEDIVFVGTPEERERALEVYPTYRDFDDGGSFLELAQLVAGSRCVIGAGSSVAALAGALKVPCVRVHDPIGTYSKMIWSNLGPGQVNETERELRRGAWDEFKSRWLAKVEVA